jgi:hypothetical protein
MQEKSRPAIEMIASQLSGNTSREVAFAAAAAEIAARYVRALLIVSVRGGGSPG